MKRSSTIFRSLCMTLCVSIVVAVISFCGISEGVSAAAVTNTVSLDQIWNRPYPGNDIGGTTFTSLFGFLNATCYYGVLPIIVDETGDYSISDLSTNSIDSMIYVYQGSFDPVLRDENFLIGNDDQIGISLQFSISAAHLEAGTVYYLVITTFASGEPASDQIDVSISGPGTAHSTVALQYTAGVGGTISGTNEQTVPVASSGSEVVAVPDTGYKFVGWSDGVSTASRTDSDCVDNLSVSAAFELLSFVVSFDTLGGSSVPSQTIQYSQPIAPAVPSREGYTFSGWYYDAACTSKVDDAAVFTGAITLYAGWTINTYTVTFQNWDNTVLGVATVNYGSAATAPAIPTREGYTFSGWSQPFASVTGDVVSIATYTQNTGVLGASVATPTPTATPASAVAGVTKTGETGGNIFFLYAIILLAFAGLSFFAVIKRQKNSKSI